MSGTVPNPNAPFDPDKNKSELRSRKLHGATLLEQVIHYINLVLAPDPARIDMIIDSKTGAENDVVTPGGMFTLMGKNFKVAGQSTQHDTLGVSFFSTGTPNLNISVTENLALNEPHKIIGIVPDLIDGRDWHVRIRTRFMSSGLLKETREIMSSFTVKKAPTP
jgi:hypothetical protein